MPSPVKSDQRPGGAGGWMRDSFTGARANAVASERTFNSASYWPICNRRWAFLRRGGNQENIFWCKNEENISRRKNKRHDVSPRAGASAAQCASKSPSAKPHTDRLHADKLHSEESITSGSRISQPW